MTLNTPTVDTTNVQGRNPNMVGTLTIIHGKPTQYWPVANRLRLYSPLQTGLPGGIGHECSFTNGTKFYGLDLFQDPKSAHIEGEKIGQAVQAEELNIVSQQNLIIMQRLVQVDREKQLRMVLDQQKSLSSLTFVYLQFQADIAGFIAVKQYVGDRLPACVLSNTIARGLDQKFNIIPGEFHLVDIVTDIGHYESFLAEIEGVIRYNLSLQNRVVGPLYNIFL